MDFNLLSLTEQSGTAVLTDRGGTNSPLDEKRPLGQKSLMAYNNIAHLRKARGLSQKELATTLGTTENTLGKLERGARRLHQDWIDRISDALKCEPSEIIDPIREPDRTNGQSPSLVQRPSPQHQAAHLETDDMFPVPLRRIKFDQAIEYGSNFEDWIDDKPCYFDQNSLLEITSTAPELLLIGRAIDTTMEPTIGRRDDIMINIAENEITRFDGIYALKIAGAVTIKRLALAGDGMVQLISDNPSHPDPVRKFPRSAMNIIGRIIWSSRKH
jgi:transcriptional regulator with XRE-family HTH domain